MPIGEMAPDEIRGAYVLYIGAGAVAAGGIISLLRSLPTIWGSLREGLKDFRGGAAARASLLRTERDLSMKVVLVGSLGADRRHHAGAAAAHEPARRLPDRRPRLPVRHRVVAADRRDRLVVESDLRHDGRDAAAHLPGLPAASAGPGRRTTSRRSRSARSSASRRRTAARRRRISRPASWSARRRATSRSRSSSARWCRRCVLGPILLQLNDAATVYVPRVSKEPVAGGAGGHAARRRELPGDAARRSGDADRHERPTQGTRVPRLAQAVDATAGRRASTWSTRAARRSTSSIPASTASIATRRTASGRSRSSTRRRRR